MNHLPYQWADWVLFEKRLQGSLSVYGKRGGFICWAESAPENLSEYRYAVVNDGGLVRWCRVSPNPDTPWDLSPGAFYDAYHPQGAVQDAKERALQHKAKVRALVEEFLK